MAPVYFDSSVLLAILGKDKSAPKIKLLLRELKRKKIRIITSILTIQEVSVRVYMKGTPAHDNHGAVSKLARIVGIDRDTALTAAKYEAHALDQFKGNEQDKAIENKRRKFDCFHIASAVINQCGTLYSLDEGMLKRRDQFKIPNMAFLRPEPTEPMLDLQPELPLQNPKDTTASDSLAQPPASPSA